MTDFHDWKSCDTPALESAEGRFVRLGPARFHEDAAALFDAIGGPGNDDLWTYIPFGPLEMAEAFSAAMTFVIGQQNWETVLIRAVDTGEVRGMASYMRIRPEHGSAEVGCIIFSKKLQRTPAATEAMYLMARHIFEARGYRRYEWKCHNGNLASRRAANRFGFVFEGVFRQDQVMKGQNRDTAWYSITDGEWPQVKSAFETWLAPENFDGEGRQRKTLSKIRDLHTPHPEAPIR